MTIHTTDPETPPPAKLFQSIRKKAAHYGAEILKLALSLWYCLCDPDTPAWCRSAILGPLAYLVSPIDAIPDLVPGGLTDDLAVLALAVATLGAHITSEHRRQAAQTIRTWFRGHGELING